MTSSERNNPDPVCCGTGPTEFPAYIRAATAADNHITPAMKIKCIPASNANGVVVVIQSITKKSAIVIDAKSVIRKTLLLGGAVPPFVTNYSKISHDTAIKFRDPAGMVTSGSRAFVTGSYSDKSKGKACFTSIALQVCK